MVNIIFYNFTKEHNSTKQPASGAGASFACLVKEPCDILAPAIELNTPDPVSYNYAYIPAWNRYYFITGIRFNAGLWELTARVDVLATYRAAIGAERLYVLRSSAASNGYIRDNYYPTTSISHGRAEDDTFIPSSYGLGVYIVNVTGIATAGASTLWLLSPAQFRNLISALYTEIDGYQPADTADAIKKLVGGQPEKLVSSAMWLPAYNFAGTVQEIVIGTWHSNVTGLLISDPLYTVPPIELALPKHPQASSRGQFLNLAPYTTYTLTIPMFGAINIDTTAVRGADNIYLNITVDALTGQGKCRVHAGDSPIIAELTAQIGAAVPLQGQSAGASVAGGIVVTLAAAAGAIASGGAALPVIGAVSSGIGTVLSAVTGASFSTGSAGGALATIHGIQLDATFISIASEDNRKNGRPLCEVRQPETLGGFMLIQNGDVPINGTEAESEEIKRILESGFYYE